MKNYKTKEEIIADMKIAFSGNNPFDRYTFERLDNPEALINEYRTTPTLRLVNSRGDWFFIWKNQSVKIDSEWIKVENLLNRLADLL